MPRQAIVAQLTGFLAACIFLAGCGGGSGTPTIASIVISSPQSSIAVSSNTQFIATAEDKHGRPITGIVFTWFSTAANVAPINSNGTASGLLPGTTQVTASAGGITSNQVML